MSISLAHSWTPAYTARPKIHRMRCTVYSTALVGTHGAHPQRDYHKCIIIAVVIQLRLNSKQNVMSCLHMTLRTIRTIWRC